MPRPPILPPIDWPSVFESGVDFETWMNRAESPENRRKIEEGLASMHLDPMAAAALAALPRPVRVVAIAEDWCGDVVRHVPVLQRMVEASPRLSVRYLARTACPDVFARFLTNGGEAIPMFVFLSEAWVECGHWGPMPEACRELIARGKACGNLAQARQKVSGLYALDLERRTVVSEILRILDIASTPSL